MKNQNFVVGCFVLCCLIPSLTFAGALCNVEYNFRITDQQGSPLEGVSLSYVIKAARQDPIRHYIDQQSRGRWSKPGAFGSNLAVKLGTVEFKRDVVEVELRFVKDGYKTVTRTDCIKANEGFHGPTIRVEMIKDKSSRANRPNNGNRDSNKNRSSATYPKEESHHAFSKIHDPSLQPSSDAYVFERGTGIDSHVKDEWKKLEGVYFRSSHHQYMHILTIKDNSMSYDIYWRGEGSKLKKKSIQMKIKKIDSTVDYFRVWFEVSPWKTQFDVPWKSGGGLFLMIFGDRRIASFRSSTSGPNNDYKPTGNFEEYTYGISKSGIPKVFISR